MKRTTKIYGTLLLAAGTTVLWGCWKKSHVGTHPDRLPQDVMQSCTVDSTEFNSWFVGGSATENGMVMPANSLGFPHNNNCDFYKWSEQMFLWLTSPTAPGSTVLQSPVFYTVSPEENGSRVLVQHKPGALLEARSNIRQTGPNELPVVIDDKGRMFEVESNTPDRKEMVRTAAGKLVEADHIELAGGKVLFKDKNNKEIVAATPNITHKLNANRIVRRMLVGGKPEYVDAGGNVVNVELGQAGSSGALMAQNGSLVYYISMVNDVYAYFMSGVRNQALDSSTFPTDSASLAAVMNYASLMNWPAAPDPNALAMELKTSWVETTGLADSDEYVKVNAMIPTYDTTNANAWVVSGSRPARLALIGMHIVGSAAGHPEMIWATFEHENNAPNEQYTYLDSTGTTKTMVAETGNHWLLNSNGSGSTFNVQNIYASNDSLYAYQGNSISPSNTRMICPYGVAVNVVPNAENATPGASNSQVISINNAVRSLLKGNDIRRHYILIGATWTSGGAAPTGESYSYPLAGFPGTAVDTAAGVAIGTSQLANSTMETYVQDSASTYSMYGSCLSCHSNNSSLSPDALSHIFDDLLPLPADTGSSVGSRKR